MTHTLDQEQIRVMVQLRHEEFLYRDQATPRDVDPLSVGAVAADIASHIFYGDAVGASSQSHQAVLANCVGMLIYAMEKYGYSFDAICDFAEYQVARAVSGLSPDIRLPAGQRTAYHCSTLANAEPVAQIVKLAEISLASDAVRHASDGDFALHVDAYKRWADDSLIMLTAMTKLRGYPYAICMIADIKKTLIATLRRVETTRKPKRERQAVVTVTAVEVNL